MRLPVIFCLGLPLGVLSAQGAKEPAIHAIEQFVRDRAAADSFSGAVLVARNGVPLVRAGFGLADRANRLPVTPETKFNLGSVDKLITRIAIWQLVAAGKLELGVPIGTYLPDYPNRAVRDKVTARHLYQMSSGVGGFFNDEFLRRHERIRTVDDYLSLFASDSLRFEPGTSRLYGFTRREIRPGGGIGRISRVLRFHK